MFFKCVFIYTVRSFISLSTHATCRLCSVAINEIKWLKNNKKQTNKQKTQTNKQNTIRYTNSYIQYKKKNKKT